MRLTANEYYQAIGLCHSAAEIAWQDKKTDWPLDALLLGIEKTMAKAKMIMPNPDFLAEQIRRCYIGYGLDACRVMSGRSMDATDWDRLLDLWCAELSDLWQLHYYRASIYQFLQEKRGMPTFADIRQNIPSCAKYKTPVTSNILQFPKKARQNA